MFYIVKAKTVYSFKREISKVRMYSAHEITGGFAPKKCLNIMDKNVLKAYYKNMWWYICSLNLYVFLNVFAVEAYAASWIEIPIVFCGFTSRTVEAYAASWIEMYPTMPTARYPSGRGLRSLVDWNWNHLLTISAREVEAYAASWIEILKTLEYHSNFMSRLTQPRGLKSCR